MINQTEPDLQNSKTLEFGKQMYHSWQTVKYMQSFHKSFLYNEIKYAIVYSEMIKVSYEHDLLAAAYWCLKEDLLGIANIIHAQDDLEVVILTLTSKGKRRLNQ